MKHWILLFFSLFIFGCSAIFAPFQFFDYPGVIQATFRSKAVLLTLPSIDLPSGVSNATFVSNGTALYYRLGTNPANGLFTEYWFLPERAFVFNPAYGPGLCTEIPNYNFSQYQAEQSTARSTDSIDFEYTGLIKSKSTCDTYTANTFRRAGIMTMWNFQQIFGLFLGPGLGFQCAQITGNIDFKVLSYRPNQDTSPFFNSIPTSCWTTVLNYCDVNYNYPGQPCDFPN